MHTLTFLRGLLLLHLLLNRTFPSPFFYYSMPKPKRRQSIERVKGRGRKVSSSLVSKKKSYRIARRVCAKAVRAIVALFLRDCLERSLRSKSKERPVKSQHSGDLRELISIISIWMPIEAKHLCGYNSNFDDLPIPSWLKVGSDQGKLIHFFIILLYFQI